MSLNHLRTLVAIVFLTTLSSFVFSQSINTDLIHYYPFSGNANDAIGNKNGTTMGGVSLTTDRHNNANSAYDFDGINDQIQTNGWDLSDTDVVTISAMVKPDNITSSTYYNITRQGPWPANYLLAFQHNGTLLSFGIHSGNVYLELDVAITASNYTDGNWHCITGVYDGKNMYLYSDGKLIGTRTKTGKLAAPGTIKQSIGSYLTREFFDGKIDEVRVYKRALDSNDVKMLCDSTWTYVNFYDTLCSGDSLYAAGGFRKTTGIYKDTVVVTGGIDTIKSTYLQVYPRFRSDTIITLCSGILYTFPDGDTSSGARVDTSLFQSQHGCDSLIITDLRRLPVATTQVSVSQCQGLVYTFPDGDTSSISTTDTSLLTGIGGCDSLVITQLTVTPPSPVIVNAVICQGQNYVFPDGDSSSIATTDTSLITSAGGCDSLVITHLIVTVQGQPTFVNAMTCQDQVHTFPDGDTSSIATVDTSIVTNQQGCVMTIITFLGVTPKYRRVDYDTICGGNTYTFPDGTKSDTSMVQMSKLNSSSGCDSIIETHLWVNPTSYKHQLARICEGESYTFPDGSVTTVAGSRNFYYQTHKGCDSIIHISLLVSPSHTIQRYDSICHGETYTYPGGATTSTSGKDTVRYQTAFGCDSTVITHLTVNQIDTAVWRFSDSLLAHDPAASHYQWINCETGQAISGANQRAFGFTQNGSYAVVVSRFGCTDTSACYSIETVGTRDLTLNSNAIRLFPNPTSGELFLEWSMSPEPYQVQVLDLSGKVIQSQRTIQEQQYTLDLSQLSTGMYILQIEQGGSQSRFRVIKQD
ncbi:T9SS type A sorting domain-containing protein [bacterium SCSIO 12741]|nr:T9SS type A sorting domain-containing protein [bacterium SCSIO 12741]